MPKKPSPLLELANQYARENDRAGLLHGAVMTNNAMETMALRREASQTCDIQGAEVLYFEDFGRFVIERFEEDEIAA